MTFQGVGIGLYIHTQVSKREGKGLLERLPETLDDVKAAGFEGIEPFLDWFPERSQSDRLGEWLSDRGLKLIGLYVNASLHTPDLAAEEIDKLAAALDRFGPILADYLDVNAMPHQGGAAKTPAEIDCEVESLDSLGAMVCQKGKRLVVHHHHQELQDGAAEYWAFVNRTNAANVAICSDPHWLHRGGVDIADFLRNTGKRLGAIHLRNDRNGVFAEALEDGDIDFRAIRDVLTEIGYTGWLMAEPAHAPNTAMTRSFRENLKRSREYVMEVFGA